MAGMQKRARSTSQIDQRARAHAEVVCVLKDHAELGDGPLRYRKRQWDTP